MDQSLRRRGASKKADAAKAETGAAHAPAAAEEGGGALSDAVQQITDLLPLAMGRRGGAEAETLAQQDGGGEEVRGEARERESEADEADDGDYVSAEEMEVGGADATREGDDGDSSMMPPPAASDGGEGGRICW